MITPLPTPARVYKVLIRAPSYGSRVYKVLMRAPSYGSRNLLMSTEMEAPRMVTPLPTPARVYKVFLPEIYNDIN